MFPLFAAGVADRSRNRPAGHPAAAPDSSLLPVAVPAPGFPAASLLPLDGSFLLKKTIMLA